jgi:hypothetical protein
LSPTRVYAAAFRFAARAALAFLRLASSLALAAGESLRLGAAFFAFGEVPARCLWNEAQRFLCAAAIRFLAAADILLRFRGWAVEPAEGRCAPRSRASMSAIACAVLSR